MTWQVEDHHKGNERLPHSMTGLGPAIEGREENGRA